jgi:DNA-directed RNA polymerase subunit RPC12/RpoP
MNNANIISMGYVFLVLIIIAIVYAILKPKRCSICGVPFKKRYYKWKIENKKQYLCPNCNRKMEKKVSDSAFKNKLNS